VIGGVAGVEVVEVRISERKRIWGNKERRGGRCLDDVAELTAINVAEVESKGVDGRMDGRKMMLGCTHFWSLSLTRVPCFLRQSRSWVPFIQKDEKP
jgi:hypothetical protein